MALWKKVDVTTDKHFAGTLSTISNLFSLFDDPIRRDSVGYVSPKTKDFVHTAFLVPNSYNELLMRRRAFETWSYATDGVMSRLSDYARSRLTGWYVSRYFYKNSMRGFQIKLHLIMKKREISTRF